MSRVYMSNIYCLLYILLTKVMGKGVSRMKIMYGRKSRFANCMLFYFCITIRCDRGYCRSAALSRSLADPTVRDWRSPPPSTLLTGERKSSDGVSKINSCRVRDEL